MTCRLASETTLKKFVLGTFGDLGLAIAGMAGEPSGDCFQCGFGIGLNSDLGGVWPCQRIGIDVDADQIAIDHHLVPEIRFGKL